MKIETTNYTHVATGNVFNGEWMRRNQAEAEGVKYRDLTPKEASEIDRQIEAGE